MDIEGQFCCHFTVQDQSFGEKFKVILHSSVSILDKNGDLKRIRRTEHASDWILVDEKVKKKINEGFDIRHLISDDKENVAGNERTERNVEEKGSSTKLSSSDFDSDAARISLTLNLENFQIKTCQHKPSRSYNRRFTLGHKISQLNMSTQKNICDLINKNKFTGDSSDSVAVSEIENVMYIAERNEIHGLYGENVTNESNTGKLERTEDSQLSVVTYNVPNAKSDSHIPDFRKDKVNEAPELEALELQVYQCDSENNDSDNETDNDSECEMPPVLETTTETPPYIEDDKLLSDSDIKVEQPLSPVLKNETDDIDRRYPKRARRNSRSQNFQEFYINDEILDESDEDIKSKRCKKSKKKEDLDAEYLPSDEVQSEKSDSEDQALSDEDVELKNEDSSKADIIRSEIDKYKKILIHHGQKSRIPAEEMDSRVLLAKLRFEVKLLKRIKVTLAEHTDKFEMQTFTSNEQKLRNTKIEEKSHELFACKICDKFQTSSEETMRAHLEEHLNGELQCKWCGVELAHRGDKQAHNRTNHPEKNKQKVKEHHLKICEMCGQSCKEGHEFKHHMFRAHGIPSFECRVCAQKLHSHVKYVSHMKSAHPEHLYTCEKCDRRFIEHGRMTYHTVRCKGDKETLTCHLCGLTLANTNALKSHIRRTHHKEKLHKCTICTYSCFTPQKLKLHMDAHLGIKNYKCDICDFATVQSYQLTSHLRIHTKEKPFKCDQCTYASAWNVQLKSK